MPATKKQRTSTWHREFMRRIAIGEPPAEAAKDLGFSPAGARNLMKSPMFQQELAEMQKEIDKATYDAIREMRTLQPEAVKALSQLVKNKKRPDLRLAAAREILNRTGAVTPIQQRIEVTQSASLTYEERLGIAAEEPQKQIEYIDSEVTVLEGEALEATDDNIVEEKPYED